MGEVLIGGTAAVLICVFLSPRFIAFLRVREFGQHIREEGPEGHHAKAGTPTMGGIIIFLAVSAPFLILSDYDWRAVGVYLAAMLCALLGFADDYTKIIRRRSLGLRARTKLGVTIAISLLLWYVATQKANLPATEPATANETVPQRQLPWSFVIGPPPLSPGASPHHHQLPPKARSISQPAPVHQSRHGGWRGRRRPRRDPDGSAGTRRAETSACS